ncbi:MAG: hypothetical protein INR69_08855 [Mucilaginibacter polytrichastri]|nr:hypothetical protein [Mucilaginibacter polytrichastri]
MKRLPSSPVRTALLVFALALFTFSDSFAQRPSRGGGGGGFSGGRGGGGGFSRGSMGGGGFRGGQMQRPGGTFNRGSVVPRDRGTGYNRPIYRTPGRSNYYYNRGNYWGGNYWGGGWGGWGLGGFYRPWGWGMGWNYGYAPFLGMSFGYLPFGYSSFMWGPNTYYYNDGYFYRRYSDNDYRIVPPPIGAEVKRLPKEASSVTIDGQQYFERDGVYYQETRNAKGKKMYKVVGRDGELNTGENGMAPIVGDVVDQLPTDSRPITLNNVRYYVSPADVYYEEVNDSGKTQYRVVRTPESEKTTPDADNSTRRRNNTDTQAAPATDDTRQ